MKTREELRYELDYTNNVSFMMFLAWAILVGTDNGDTWLRWVFIAVSIFYSYCGHKLEKKLWPTVKDAPRV